VVEDAVASRVLCSRGAARRAAFWVDCEEGITATFFTQLLPSSTYPLRSRLRRLVYRALIA
jgi:hypothetical protein